MGSGVCAIGLALLVAIDARAVGVHGDIALVAVARLQAPYVKGMYAVARASYVLVERVGHRCYLLDVIHAVYTPHWVNLGECAKAASLHYPANVTEPGHQSTAWVTGWVTGWAVEASASRRAMIPPVRQ